MPRILCVVGLLLGCVSAVEAQETRSGSLAFGTAAGRPGEVVEIPVVATFEDPLPYFAIVFTYDVARLEYLRFVVEGTAAAPVDPIGVSYRTYGPGEAFCGVFATRGSEYGYRIPPGADVTIGKLRFRVRAAAAEGSAQVSPERTVSGTAGGTTFDFGSVAAAPETLAPGSVEVAPPTGPRPVGDLACRQAVERTLVTFQPTEPYEAIEVRRGAQLVGTLAGSATSFEEPVPWIGRVAYEVVAVKAGAASVAIGCEVLVTPPAAPPVEELVCDGATLAWEDPLDYEAITVFRDGDAVASLDGSTTTWTDPEHPGRPALYTVIGELRGYRSPEVHCFSEGVWIVEVGDVLVPPGATRILVPILVTTSMPSQGIGFCIDLDMGRLGWIEERDLSFRGTVGYPEPEFFESHFVGPDCPGPVAGLLFDMVPPVDTWKDLPVGLRQHVLNFVFEPQGEFADGETIPVTPLQTYFTARHPSRPFEIVDSRAGTHIPGEIRFGSGGLDAVEELVARVDGAGDGGGAGGPADVVLSWRNGSVYDSVRIERNGERLGEISGSTTEYVDRGLETGVFTYKVVGVRDGETSFPASALVSTFRAPGTFLRGDANRDGRVNISDPVAALNFLFRSGPALACDDAADANDDGSLNLTDPIVTIQYLFIGATVLTAPGTAHAWFDPTPDGLTCRR